MVDLLAWHTHGTKLEIASPLASQGTRKPSSTAGSHVAGRAGTRAPASHSRDAFLCHLDLLLSGHPSHVYRSLSPDVFVACGWHHRFPHTGWLETRVVYSWTPERQHLSLRYRCGHPSGHSRRGLHSLPISAHVDHHFNPWLWLQPSTLCSCGHIASSFCAQRLTSSLLSHIRTTVMAARTRQMVQEYLSSQIYSHIFNIFTM